MSADSRLVAGGPVGGIEEPAHARVCRWCDIPHPIGLVDRQLLDQDAQITHGMCEAAEARLNAELARAIEEEHRTELPCR